MLTAYTSDLFAMVKDLIKVLSWNCRGASNPTFMRNLRDLIAIHKPTILALLETRVSGPVADRVCQQIGWGSWYRVEAAGFSGGIWIFWKEEVVDVKVIHGQSQFVHLSIRTKDGDTWFLSVVYANPKPVERRLLWDEIRRV